MAEKVARVSLMALSLWIVASVTAPAVAQPPPPIPHSFYGAVEINGAPAPVGTEVEARGTEVLTGVSGNPLTVTQAGQYGGPGGFDPKLVVQGQVAAGTPIEFYVDGVRAECAVPGGPWEESYPFSSGAVTELNLTLQYSRYDFDQDCVISVVDIMPVASRWATSCDNPDPDNDPDTPNYAAAYDLDSDCDIDIVDIMAVAGRWGCQCGDECYW